jgi:DHA1 family bicyclomycin/chloramphenicol resistance-like MFS transporter
VHPATDSASSAPRSGAEFIALLAMATSLAAFSVDAMLPALPQIARDLGIERENDRQLLVTVLLFGMAAGQLFYGPVSDSVGRKPAIYVGFGVFLVGTVLCLAADNLGIMLAGRLLQGLGAAGPRILVVAMVRDRFAGPAMARVMSLISSVFILVPVIAPSLGQALTLLGSWHLIFALLLLQALAALVWLAWRQPETLPPERRIPFTPRRIAAAFREVFRTRVAIGYALSAGFVYGAFVGWLSSCQQILQEQYELGPLFPLAFASLALSIGAAAVLNARLVMRLGMRRLASNALAVLTGLSACFFLVSLAVTQPPLWMLLVYLLAVFFCMGVLFGNFNALAMEPLGHIAGVAAAVVGLVVTVLSTSIGTALGQAYDGTIRPIVAGFALLGLASAGFMSFAERGRAVRLNATPR